MDLRRNIKVFIGKLLHWYFSKQALPYWCVLLCDCFIVFISLCVAHTINYGYARLEHHWLQLFLSVFLYLFFFILAFRCFHTYRGVIRYSSFIDLVRLAAALFMGSSLVQLSRACINSGNFLAIVSFYDLLYGSLIALVLMLGVRIFIKVAYDTRFLYEKTENAMIFGTQEGGVGIAKSIRSQHPVQYNLVGFITNYPDMMGHTLMNQPILSDTDPHLVDFIRKKHVRTVLVSPLVQDFFVNNCQNMIDLFIQNDIKIMMMPREQEWDGSTNINHSTLKAVSVEDLLPRQKIEVDMEAIGKMLRGKRILITGAAGSIGHEMVKQVAKFQPEEMILIDQAETPMHDTRLMMANRFPDVKALTIVTSITNATHMEQLFRDHRPEYVFHAAAYKHVPMMEDNPALAIQNNVYGTRVIADMAVKYGTKKFVMISTDKAVNPTNVMGCSKRICEIYCQALNKKLYEHAQATGEETCQFVTTRFGNVLGSNGSVIPTFKQQILHGGPVTVTHPDIIRFFMLIPEACRLVLEAGTMGHGGEIFVFDMGEPVRIADLAQRMIDLMGAKDVKIIYTGLRDGEKLYEEVLNDEEQTKPTNHPKIKIASVREYPYEEALKNEQDLYDLSLTYDDMAIVKKMKEIVPEYKSRQSKYEVLD